MQALTRISLCLGALLALAACAAGPLRPALDGGLSEAGLQRMSGTTFDEVWLRPGTDFSAYRGVVLEPTSVTYREVDEGIRIHSPRLRVGQDAYPIPTDQRERIEAAFESRLSAALDQANGLRRASIAGPGTLSLRAVLVDFVSRVPPQEALTRVYVTSVGEATLIVELWDDERDELLLRAIDHERAGPPGAELIRANHVTSWVEIDRQMQRWGTQVRGLLEQLAGS